MKNPLKVTLSALTVAALALTLSACSPDKKDASPRPTATPTASPTPLLSIPKLTGANTQLALSGKFNASVKSAGVKIAAGGGTTAGRFASGSGLSFPVTGGSIQYYNPKVRASLPNGVLEGSILHQGSGFTLTKGGTKVVVQDVVVTPGIKGSITGDLFVNNKSVGNDTLLFNVDGSTIKPLSQDSTGNALLNGYKATLAAPFAKVLDQRLNTKAFTAKEAVGDLTLTLKLPKGKK